jgi:hypothetical protein
MAKFLKFFSWLLFILGLISLVLTFVVYFEHDPKHKGAVSGFIMFALFFGLPGLTLLYHLRKKERDQIFRNELIGFIKTLSSFTASELGQKIGKTEMETETLLARLITEEKLGIGFHRPSRKYFHRDRLQEVHHSYKRCRSCGADLGRHIFFEGEEATCPYCDQSLE